jgi:glycosyltransferase involved in cell wall biosynthesis
VDALASPDRNTRVLLELRAALDKHAGIPQQTRLLFRGLSLSPELSVEGLLQSSTHALGSALPPERRRWFGSLPRHRQVDRLSRVIIRVEQKFLRSWLSPVAALGRRVVGAREPLTRFETTHFRDFIWRRLFAKTLPASDFDLVTRADFRVAGTPWTAMHVCGLITRTLGRALFPRIKTSGFDVMISETPYPAMVSGRTRLIVRYHDAIPLLLPHTISDRRHHQSFHYHALRCNVESGAWFVCVSESTRRDLLSIFPQVESRSVTIHNIVSHDYFDEPSRPEQVLPIVRSRANPRIRRFLRRGARDDVFIAGQSTGAPNYLLIVSTIEPRKNHLTLLSAWEVLRAKVLPDLKLIIVGSLGWHHAAIVQKLLPHVEAGDVAVLEDVPSRELRVLYRHARATVCPSFAEGFDLSGIESMMSGGVVVASDIPVHREIYMNGACYFDPYSAEDLGRVLFELVAPAAGEQREDLIAQGAAVASRYTSDVILPKWLEFLAMVTSARDSGSRVGSGAPVVLAGES